MDVLIIVIGFIVSLVLVFVIGSKFEARRVKRVLAELEAKYDKLPDCAFSEQCQVQPGNEDIAVIIRNTIAETIGIPSERIHADAPLVELLAASFDGEGSIELAMVLEEKFSIEIPDKILVSLETPSDIFRYIVESMGSKEEKA